MKTEWSHLPNAAHIDCVLASVKAHTEEWVAFYDAAYDEAYDAARRAAAAAALDADRSVARSATWVAARSASWVAAWDPAWSASWDAIAALIAWDDCSQYLDMPSEKLEVWYHLSKRPECLLLLPAVRAFEKINELELVDS